MTREDILAMAAGRELDALVAEKVMEWYWADTGRGLEGLFPPDKDRVDIFLFDDLGHWRYMKNYSTDISAAWDVVEKMRDSEYEYQFNQHMDRGSFTNVTPLIICRAALLTVLEESL